MYLVSFDFYWPSKWGSYFCRTLYKQCTKNTCVTSGFRREVDGNGALLSYYAASSGNLLLTFLTTYLSHLTGSIIQEDPLKMGRIGCPETSVSNYRYSLCNNSGQCNSCIVVIKANKMHNFLDLFDKLFYTFRTCPLSIIRSISTLYTSNRYLSC